MENDGDYEVTYRCSTPKCGNEQVLKFFANEPPLPATNCVACRAGFGVELPQMVQRRIGMFPKVSA